MTSPHRCRAHRRLHDIEEPPPGAGRRALSSLCRQLWRYDEVPTLESVRQAWHSYVIQQSGWIESDLSRLSINRRKVLSALAYQVTNEPLGHEFSSRVGLTPSSIKKSLMDLQRLDMLYQSSKEVYKVLDPAMAYYLRMNKIIN